MDLNSNFVIIVLFHNTHALLVLNIKNWQNIFTWQIHTQTKPISKWRLHTILLDSEFKNTKLITTTNNSIIIITFVIYHYQRHHQHQQHYHDQELATKLESAPSELFTRLFPDIQDCTVEKVCRTPPSPPLSSSPPLSLHRREGLPKPPQLTIKKGNMIKHICLYDTKWHILIIAGTSSPIRTAKFQPGRWRGREVGGPG